MCSLMDLFMRISVRFRFFYVSFSSFFAPNYHHHTNHPSLLPTLPPSTHLRSTSPSSPNMTVLCTPVVTNSDGEYAETVDYKPSPKRTPAGHAAAAAQAMEEPYQLHDSQGNVRLCYHCHKSAFGSRMMISCEHCPLHWHLDCLSPPMASPPPSTRKWMCPNHSDHILVRKAGY